MADRRRPRDSRHASATLALSCPMVRQVRRPAFGTMPHVGSSIQNLRNDGRPCFKLQSLAGLDPADRIKTILVTW